MKQFNNISTLIFDFGGVLINLDLAQCIQNLNNLGLNNVEKYLSNFGQSDFFMKYEKGEIDTPEFRENIRNICTNAVTDEQIDSAWCSFLTNIPNEKLELLLKLKKKFRVILLSNTNPLHIEVSAASEFAKAGKTLYDFFDHAYLSYEMKMVKPTNEIFEKILELEQVPANECLFLDDGEKNILQAKKLGIQTYWVEPNENLDFLLDEDTFTDKFKGLYK